MQGILASVITLTASRKEGKVYKALFSRVTSSIA
jgi:hypothetical protein